MSPLSTTLPGTWKLLSRVFGALSRENVGVVLTRAMQVHGHSLVIKLDTTMSDGTPVTRALTWQRVA